MPHVLTIGSVEKKNGVWRARVSFPKNPPAHPVRRRAWFWLPEGIDEARARQLAKELGALARSGRLTFPERGAVQVHQPSDANLPDRTADGKETVKGWCLRWLAARRLRDMKSVRSDESRLRTWVWPSLGTLAIAGVTRDHVEMWVETIDEKVREGELSWKTALNAWGILSKLFDDARAGKPRDLRVRADNPVEGVRPPDRGTRRAKQFLYPSEAARLLACEAIEVAVRQVYAVAIYLYPRDGELEALHCEDVDLLHNAVHIHRARHESGEIRETKGNRPRRVPIHRELAPVLARLVALAGGRGPLWPEWPLWVNAAGELRRHLARAGVDRRELLDAAATTKAMTFHDLRATGITWEAVAGTDPLRIQQRAGHSSLTTTQVYLRLAEAVGIADFGTPFPALPRDLWQAPARPKVGPPVGPPRVASPRANPMETGGGEGFRERDSNPHSALWDVSKRVETYPDPTGHPPTPPPSVRLDTSQDAFRGGAGTNLGTTGPTYTALDLALRDAVLAALDEGAHDLARELLEMLRRHQMPATEGASTGEAHGATVIDLAKRRRARGL